MRRIALIGTIGLGLLGGVAACGQSPVQPGETASTVEASPARTRPSPTPLVCESSVYPVSLCIPANRPTLCAALQGPEPVSLNVIVNARQATATFTRSVPPAASGSLEVVTIPRGYGLPPTVLKFTIGDDKIAAICPTA